jgi:DNA polymerase III epsilon subunit-like protein
MPLTNKLAWVDVETSGLFPEKGARVLELGVVVTDDKERTYNELERYHVLIRLTPEDLKVAEREALNINGYNDGDGGEWATASYSTPAIWKEFVRITRDCTMVAQNWPFDRGFIESELKRFDLSPKWSRRFIDIQSFSWLITRRHNISSFALEKAYNALGIQELKPHRSMTDIERCIAIVKHVDEYYPNREPAVAA